MTLVFKIPVMKRVATLYAVCFLALTTTGIAGSLNDWERALNSASTAFDNGDCENGWRTLWPFAKQGNPEALTSLALTIIYRSVNPPGNLLPGTTTLLESRKRHIMALSLYGWRFNNHNRKAIDFLIDRKNSSAKYRQVENCLSNQKDKQACVNLAVQLKLIPTLEEYIKLIDRAPSQASCFDTNADAK